MKRLLPLILCLLLLAGCRQEIAETMPAETAPAVTEQAPETTTATENTEPVDPETVGWVMHTLRPQKKRTDFLTGRRDNSRYYFEASAWDEERCESAAARFVIFLEKARARLGYSSEQELIVYTGDCITTWQQPGKAYIASGDAEDLAAFWSLYVSQFDTPRFPGLAYGFTANICREEQLCPVPDYDEDDLAAFFAEPENEIYLDMTLPMLENRFFSEDTAAMVQSASCALAGFCIRTEGEEELCRLLTDGTAQEVAALTDAWLLSMGLDAREQEPVWEVYYYMPEPSDNYPYGLDTPHAHWSFAVRDVQEFGYADFMEGFYFAEPLVEQDFAEAQEVLQEVQRKEINTVSVYTAFVLDEYRQGTAAFYDQMDESIHIYFDWDNALYSIVHEYMHHLTIGKGKLLDTWSLLTEAIAEEAASFASTNRCQQAFYEKLLDKRTKKELRLENGLLDLETFTYMEAELYSKGYEQDDYICIAQFIRSRPDHITADALSYPEAASIMHYLVETYGRTEAYSNSVGIWELEEFLGMSFDELYAKWQRWNTLRCMKAGFYF